MSDAPSPPAPSIEGFRMMVELLERDPSAARAMQPPPPTTAELVARFPSLADVSVTDIDVATAAGVVPARLYTSSAVATVAGFVWAHGGAFVFGDLDMPEAHWVGLTLASRGIATLSVDYRKAVGDDRFPAASDDLLAAWQWATENPARFGVPASALHLGGASAGANLAAGVAKRLRDGTGPMPRTTVLVYPLVHSALPELSPAITDAYGTMPTAVRFDPDLSAVINRQYTGSDELLDDPYAFAANGDVGGQPPVLIVNAEADTLRASGEAYGAALAEAGVAVEVLYEPGTAHGHLNEPDLDAAWRTIDRLVDWFSRRASGAGGSLPP